MDRRTFVSIGAAGLAGMSLEGLPIHSLFPQTSPLTSLVWLGCYAEQSTQGVGQCLLDRSEATLSMPSLAIPCANPSFLALSNDRQFLFAVNEVAEFKGTPTGYVSSYRIDRPSGRLEFLSSSPSEGAHPCHISASRNGRFVLVANYSSGTVSVLPVGSNGFLGKPVCTVRHSGSGPVRDRQEAAHAHSVTLSPDNRFAFVCDLGIDRIMIYRFNELTGELTPAAKPWYQTRAGAGPRHFTFAPSGTQAFVINELDSTLSTFDYQALTGEISEICTVSTLPEGFSGSNTCADIHVDPTGNFVYGSNRGHDSLAIFRVQKGTGKLSLVGHQSTLGRTPRNFAIDSSGKYVIVANQNSDSLCLFRLNPSNGTLTPLEKKYSYNKPVCVIPE